MEQGPDPNGFHPELDRFLIFFIGFVFDTLTGVAVFAAFLLFGWVLGLARGSGWGNEEHFKAYEDAHFYLNIALFATVSAALSLRVFKGLWKHESDFKGVFKRRCSNFSIFLAAFGVDTLMGLTILLAFLLFARLLVLIWAHGSGDAEHLKAYELIYFWATYGPFVAVGFAFLLRVWRALWAELT